MLYFQLIHCESNLQIHFSRDKLNRYLEENRWSNLKFKFWDRARTWRFVILHMHCEFFMNPIEDDSLSQTIPFLQPYENFDKKKTKKNQGQPHRFLHLTTCCEEEEYHRPLPPTPLPPPPPPPDDAVIAEGSNMSCSEEYCRWCDRICLIAAPLMFTRSDMRGERRRR